MYEHNYYYGYFNGVPDLIRQATIICETLDSEQVFPHSRKLVLETTAQETLFGAIKDTTREVGIGICQFDPIGFHDTKVRSVRFVQSIKDVLKINVSLVSLENLRYNPFLSLLFCRLKYKLVPYEIPKTVKERWDYYKRWFNSYEGDAKRDSYLHNATKVERCLKEFEDE